MIESCNKRRMILGITFLGGLTLLVLIVESHWTSGNKSHIGVTGKNLSSENNCWLHEEYDIIVECHPCSDFDINSRSKDACLPTHSKETVKCKSGQMVDRSCEKVTWLEERNFWIFEGIATSLGLISTAVVFARQKMLDHQMLRRIQRQLASGV